MLGIGVRMASACALCLLLPASRLVPRALRESQATGPVLFVPVPVPAVRRPASVQPPQPPRAHDVHPIGNLAGKWSGQATMIPASGRNEQFHCIITYQVAGEASRVHQHLRCQGDNRNFDAVTRLDISNNKVTGVWADNVYSISGTLQGKVTDKGFIVQLKSMFFDARLSVVSSDCQQTVRVVPDDPGVMKELAATLKKC